MRRLEEHVLEGFGRERSGSVWCFDDAQLTYRLRGCGRHGCGGVDGIEKRRRRRRRWKLMEGVEEM